MRKFLVEDYEGQQIDPETGEVISFSKCKSIQLKETEPFFLTYSKQILALYNTNVFNKATKVLYKMLEFSEWNTGKVHMTIDRVEEVLDTCNISKASYYRVLNDLVDVGIIIKRRGYYQIAENMFWKGELKMREQVVNAKMKISFTPVFPEDSPEDKKREEEGEVSGT